MAVDVIKLIDEIRLKVEPIAKSDDKWWDKLGKIVEIVAPAIENVAEGLKGSDKKVIAMQVINDVWFRHFDVKYIPNVFEKKLVDFVASKTIDAVVAKFNKLGIFKRS
jgi:hypothetical protein